MSAVMPEFVLFGDSLTEWSFEEEGFGRMLGEKYAAKARVVNAGTEKGFVDLM